MKLLVNESSSSIILFREDGGVLKLAPKGSQNDRVEVDDKIAASEAVKKFLAAKKVSLLSAEEAAKRAAEEKKQVVIEKTAVDSAPKTSSAENVPEVKNQANAADSTSKKQLTSKNASEESSAEPVRRMRGRKKKSTQ